jgi:hypothetical protein
MSTTVYEGALYNDICTKDLLMQQLEKALADLKAGETSSFYFDFAGLHIEIDRNESAIYVIA